MRYKKTGRVLVLVIFGVSLIFAATPPFLTAVGLPGASPPEPNPQEETPGDPPETVIPHAPETREPQASGHFLLSEYACDCAGDCDGWPAQMSPALLERIEALRCPLDRPVIITSGVRCEARNAEVGGVAWSFHMRGCAADLYCPGVAVGEMAGAAKDVGLNVLPYYAHGYIHVEI